MEIPLDGHYIWACYLDLQKTFGVFVVLFFSSENGGTF